MRNRLDSEKMRRWLKVSGLVLSVLMLRVWENVHARGLERRLAAMRLEADRLTYENGRLQMQIHQYVSPSHLEEMAKTKYAMGPLDPSHRIWIQP